MQAKTLPRRVDSSKGFDAFWNGCYRHLLIRAVVEEHDRYPGPTPPSAPGFSLRFKATNTTTRRQA